MKNILNVRETATYINRSVNNTLDMLHNGTIPAIRSGKRWMVSKEILDEWLRTESYDQSKKRKLNKKEEV